MYANDKMRNAMVLFVITLLIAIGMRVELQNFADDFIFSHALDHTSLHDYMIKRYQGWSGRFTLDALMVSTINYHIVWKIGIPASLLILCASVSKIISGKVNLALTTAFLCLFMLIPFSINENAAWWVTGFYNYLLPVSMLSYSMSVFLKTGKVNFSEGFAAVISLSISCFNEQTAFFTLAVTIIAIAINKLYRRKFSYIYLLFSLINSALLFLSPGNFIRAEKESWRWLPGFKEMPLLNKLTFGFDRIHQTVVMHDGVIFGIICVLSLIIIRKFSQKSKISLFFSSVLVIHLILMLIKHLHLADLGVAFYNEEYLNAQRWISYSRYLSYLFSLLVIFSVFYAMAIATVQRNTIAKPMIALLIGYATIAMLSFSPTVFASWMRVLFFWEVIAATACLWIYYEFLRDDESRNTWILAGLMLAAAMSF